MKLTIVKESTSFRIFLLLFFLQSSLLNINCSEKANNGEPATGCLIYKIYNMSCPGCKLDLSFNSSSSSFSTTAALKNPSYGFSQPWSSSSSEKISISFPSSEGTMVLSQGLVFEYTDSSGTVYENFDDGFQLEQSVPEPNNLPLTLYDYWVSGTFSGQLRNKANSGDIRNASGTIQNLLSDYSPHMSCSI
ncbi:hypothetical protein EHQ52_04775 [Leptospira koniambonensis]|uniref:Uncharacterized protein n=1 Tax=Leptospira koniambonensis TaxID=2484950 RepID=A0A4V3JN78_9LEPT|nr:hypothetical protein [Leptospira koniambonensis]TGL33849.1 hypothetical protein EHQ52_04775 [Leptospira koniambonensis]